MKANAKLMPVMLVAGVFALPALARCTNPAGMRSEATDVQNAVNAGLTPTEWQGRSRKGITSRALEGRRVLRANGQSLGFILGVNDIAREVEVQTSGDPAITVPESELRVDGGKIYDTGVGRVAMK